ncbi:MAG: hypothetical protein MI923_07350 [Phycisphaerales bacterium]|nr:hypothetical protein [Phycisphaerales bacterium]
MRDIAPHGVVALGAASDRVYEGDTHDTPFQLPSASWHVPVVHGLRRHLSETVRIGLRVSFSGEIVMEGDLSKPNRKCEFPSLSERPSSSQATRHDPSFTY